MFKALILIDNDQVDYSIDLVGAALQLAGDDPVELYGLGINLADKQIKGFDTLISVDLPKIQTKDSRMITDIMEQVQRDYQFDSIIVLATDFGRMVAPRLAMRLRVGLVADITAIDVDQKGRKLIRPAFSGNMLASIICDSSPIMASVHPNIFHAPTNLRIPEIINYETSELKASTIEVLASNDIKKEKDIREAAVLVAAGAGYLAPVEDIEPLAKLLGGQVAVSKPVVEQNRASRTIQVGQSGKTVSPNLYIALGIYGSMQHIEGLKNVQDIISVNIDKGAPMNYLATITVLGDAVEFVNLLTKRLAK